MGNTLPKDATFEQKLRYAGKLPEDRAVDFLEPLINELKMARDLPGAIKATETLISRSSDNGRNADLSYDVGKMYKKLYNTDQYREWVQKAIQLYCLSGRFRSAGRYYTELGEQEQDINRALAWHEKSLEYYEDDSSDRVRTQTKIALLYAELGRYREARDLFETIAKHYAASETLRYSLPVCLFRAGLCALREGEGDRIPAYVEQYPTAGYAKELRFLEKIRLTENVDEFTGHVKDYNEMSTLDDWTVSMLLGIKQRLGEIDLC